MADNVDGRLRLHWRWLEVGPWGDCPHGNGRFERIRTSSPDQSHRL